MNPNPARKSLSWTPPRLTSTGHGHPRLLLTVPAYTSGTLDSHATPNRTAACWSLRHTTASYEVANGNAASTCFWRAESCVFPEHDRGILVPLMGWESRRWPESCGEVGSILALSSSEIFTWCEDLRVCLRYAAVTYGMLYWP